MKTASVSALSRRGVLLGGISALAACQVGPGAGVPVNRNQPVPVGLLLPFGSEQKQNDVVATALQNAAQLAVSDLQEVRLELAVHNTAGDPDRAAEAAAAAAADGARILLGPLYGSAATRAAAAAPQLNVLSFSNNADIAGGNLFILGFTFINTARRLLSYAAQQGLRKVMAVHAETLQERAGGEAIRQAAAELGMDFVGAGTFEFSQQGVINAIRPIAEMITDTGAEIVVFASDTAGALPILTQLLPENGIDTEKVRFAGLTRWDIPASTLALPGVQGGWFAMPDPALSGAFTDRYRSAFGTAPHPLAGLAYDGVAAIGALVGSNRPDPLSAEALTQPKGFAGVNGIFRFLPDRTNERALAIAQIVDKQVTVLDPAPRSFRTTTA